MDKKTKEKILLFFLETSVPRIIEEDKKKLKNKQLEEGKHANEQV